MKNVLYVERLKLKRSKLWLLYFIGPLLGVFLAYINFFKNYDLFMQPGDNEWIEVWTQVALFMGPFVLPIMVGIYAALVCRSEHIGGGWKQLLALPIKHSEIFLGKFLTVVKMVVITMLILLIFFIGFGYLKGVEGSLPLFTILGFVIRGILACLPLILLQLIISIRAKTFGIPLAVSIVFTLPAIIVASTPLGQIYPWTQPMLAMSPEDESPIQSYFLFYTLVIGTFMVLLIYGIRSFIKRDIA
ncbi:MULTISPECIES: ABC transporter permease [Bacillaceae]|uniref:ABC transporter permease n=1 Tax=Bacillaceae TaxID=186817 RepID=UPI000588FD1F|nr:MULTISPECIES: ABC transporter permease [Bacillus]KKB42074.1 cdd2 protein [Bacillus thermotolerans]MEC1903535.1 ABC transporter permease [Bacillus atrophaeus]MEC2399268.1 ABC transporter permease [Bacillus atrophaeus]MED4436847.1 ABC transporter permease [Bacillus atrophaeus]MED4564027.1 ABC transporter permease [Bacillus atrophaeus]